MRALPARSFAYLGETAEGKTASPSAADVAEGLAGVGAGVAAPVVAGLAGGVTAAAAPRPHSALRKSLHFMPCTVPEDCAALYFTLHSCMLRACAGVAQAKAA